MITLRRGESPAWAAWVNARYQPVAVRHRAGVHLALPHAPKVTLCCRLVAADGWVGLPTLHADRPRLCAACRGGAKAAYEMRGSA